MTAQSTEERVAVLETQHTQFQQDFGDVRKKVDAMHDILTQAKGVRYVIVTGAALAGFVAGNGPKMLSWLFAGALLLFVATAAHADVRHHGARGHTAHKVHKVSHLHRKHVRHHRHHARTAATTKTGETTNVIRIAERYLGGNPTGWAHKWCARFLRLVLKQAGYRDPGTDLARAFAGYGSRTSAHVGALGVMSGHVGIVTGFEGAYVRLLSGNHGHRVAVGLYPRSRFIAFVDPV